MSKFTIVKEGYPFIGICAMATLLVGYFVGVDFAVLPLVLTAYFTYFFRNPDRPTRIDPSILYSPADGYGPGYRQRHQ